MGSMSISGGGMSLAQVQQSAAVSILKKAMNSDAANILSLMDDMSAEVASSSAAIASGHLLDTYV